MGQKLTGPVVAQAVGRGDYSWRRQSVLSFRLHQLDPRRAVVSESRQTKEARCVDGTRTAWQCGSDLGRASDQSMSMAKWEMPLRASEWPVDGKSRRKDHRSSSTSPGEWKRDERPASGAVVCTGQSEAWDAIAGSRHCYFSSRPQLQSGVCSGHQRRPSLWRR